MELKHDLEEKDEIRWVRSTVANVNLFVIEPAYLPPTLTTESFDKDDIRRAAEEGEKAAIATLAPLIDCYA